MGNQVVTRDKETTGSDRREMQTFMSWGGPCDQGKGARKRGEGEGGGESKRERKRESWNRSGPKQQLLQLVFKCHLG